MTSEGSAESFLQRIGAFAAPGPAHRALVSDPDGDTTEAVHKEVAS
ncbi:hypothetical protein ACFYXS_38115 [Streptomyces sp. NPDC002574]